MKTHKDRIREYLNTGESLTSLQAWKEIGTTRLAAQIFRLKEDGYPIAKENIKVKNRFGEEVYVTKYSKQVK